MGLQLNEDGLPRSAPQGWPSSSHVGPTLRAWVLDFASNYSYTPLTAGVVSASESKETLSAEGVVERL